MMAYQMRMMEVITEAIETKAAAATFYVLAKLAIVADLSLPWQLKITNFNYDSTSC